MTYLLIGVGGRSDLGLGPPHFLAPPSLPDLSFFSVPRPDTRLVSILPSRIHKLSDLGRLAYLSGQISLVPSRLEFARPRLRSS